jgi:hypothetical protein
MPKMLSSPVPAWTLSLFLAFSGGAQVRITEFMASNTGSTADEDGAFSDWVEIQNTTATNVNLLNWALTDNAGNASKWLFPATNLTPENFCWCSRKERTGASPVSQAKTWLRSPVSSVPQCRKFTDYWKT